VGQPPTVFNHHTDEPRLAGVAPSFLKSVALVNVPYGSSGNSMRPLGLAYIGAYLVKHGVPAVGFDFSDSQKPGEELVSTSGLSQYDFVGLSFYNTNALGAASMAKAIKLQNPHAIVIVGGPHASATYSHLLDSHPEFDIIVRNEGEITALALYRALVGGTPLAEVDGIAFRSALGTVVTSERERISNLDDLPPPTFPFFREGPDTPLYYFDRDKFTLKPAAALVSSRSCPYRCSFCAIILIGRQWRAASPRKIVDDLAELERHASQEYGHVYFLDANFFVDARRAVAVARALHHYRRSLTFSFSTRVNQLLKGKALLPELKSLGLRAVELGIESASPDALRRFSKDTTPLQNYSAVQLLSELQLQLFLDFIMFDAEATVDDLECNLTFFESTGLDSYVPWDHIFSHMTPYLGTHIRERYEELLGQTFEEDVLPQPESLIMDSRVRAIFVEINRLRPLLPRLKMAVQKAEETAAESWNRRTAAAKLDAVTLRRLPFVMLRTLVQLTKERSEVSLEDAVPELLDNRGSKVFVEEYLNHVLR
jgi:radical SAM superfamily enzyme YgiQ (UPF0313 family)